MAVSINKSATILKRIMLSNIFSRNGENLTPCLVGTHGIGKSQGVEQVASALNAYYEVIEATVMKEGEITGLPAILKDGDGENVVSFIPYYVIKEIQTLERKIFKKATSTGLLGGSLKLDPNTNSDSLLADGVFKFEDISSEDKLKLLESGEVRPFILFIDELNRVDDIVLKELMNIILTKNVNGYRLPWWVFICSAINPATQDSAYATREMDPAQRDRFFMIDVTADINAWADYMIMKGADQDMIVAIASNPECFLSKDAKKIEIQEMLPSPRSWSMLSTIRENLHTVNSSKFFTNEEKKTVNEDFFEIAASKVGATAARTIITAMNNIEDNVKISEILTGTDAKILPNIREKLVSQKAIRRKVTMNNLVNWLCENIHVLNADKTAEGKKKHVNTISQLKEYINLLDDATLTLFLKKIVALDTVRCTDAKKTPLFTMISKHLTQDLLAKIYEFNDNLKSIKE